MQADQLVLARGRPESNSGASGQTRRIWCAILSDLRRPCVFTGKSRLLDFGVFQQNKSKADPKILDSPRTLTGCWLSPYLATSTLIQKYANTSFGKYILAIRDERESNGVVPKLARNRRSSDRACLTNNDSRDHNIRIAATIRAHTGPSHILWFSKVGRFAISVRY